MSDKTKLENKIREQAISWKYDLNFQNDAIVSKTLIDQSEGTITVFAFDQHQALSEHTAPFDAFVHLLDGQLEISLAGKPVEIKQNESLIMPANVPHALKAITPSKMLLVMIRKQ